MKIGIIGPSFSIKRLHSMLHMEDAFVECVEYSCRLSRVPAILAEVQPELDGIIFTGNRYIEFADKHSAATIPWTQTRRTNAAVYRALLQAKLAGYDIHRITYDLRNSREELQRILCDELGLEPDRIALFYYNDTPAHEEYLRNPDLAGHYAEGACNYHGENFSAGRASICLTDSPSVENVMKQRGYPAFLVSFTDEDVLAALNDMRTRNHGQGPEAPDTLNALYRQGQFFDMLVSSVKRNWKQHNTLVTFSPDHGVHKVEPFGSELNSKGKPVRGHHGSDRTQDLNILHYFGVVRRSDGK